MRKIYILFSLSFFSFSFAQTYQFDFLTKYTTTNSKNKFTRDIVTYNNSDDFSYYLQLSKSETDFMAVLYDHERNLAHQFSVFESSGEGEVQFQFLYINSSKLAKLNHRKNYRYEFSEISSTSPKIILLKVFSSKRAKKPIYENELTLEKANKNLIPIYRSESLHQYHDDENGQKLGDYIISKAVEKYKSGTCQVTLKKYKNVDLQITRPKK